MALKIRKGNIGYDHRQKKIDVDIADLRMNQEYIAMMSDIDLDGEVTDYEEDEEEPEGE